MAFKFVLKEKKDTAEEVRVSKSWISLENMSENVGDVTDAIKTKQK